MLLRVVVSCIVLFCGPCVAEPCLAETPCNPQEMFDKPIQASRSLNRILRDAEKGVPTALAHFPLCRRYWKYSYEYLNP